MLSTPPASPGPLTRCDDDERERLRKSPSREELSRQAVVAGRLFFATEAGRRLLATDPRRCVLPLARLGEVEAATELAGALGHFPVPSLGGLLRHVVADGPRLSFGPGAILPGLVALARDLGPADGVGERLPPLVPGDHAGRRAWLAHVLGEQEVPPLALDEAVDGIPGRRVRVVGGSLLKAFIGPLPADLAGQLGVVGGRLHVRRLLELRVLEEIARQRLALGLVAVPRAWRRGGQAEPTPLVRVTAFGKELAPIDVEVLVRLHPTGQVMRPGEGSSEIVGTVDGERTRYLRSLERERAVAEQTATDLVLPAERRIRPFSYRFDDLDHALDVIEGLAFYADAHPGFEVEHSGLPEIVVRDLPIELRAAPSGRTADFWFQVDGTVKVDEHRLELEAVLSAISAGRRYLPIAPGRLLILSEARAERLRRLHGYTREGERGLELSPAVFPVLEDLLQDGLTLDGSGFGQQVLERARAAREVGDEPPPGLRGTLRPWQREGVRWLRRLATWGVGGILADEMGLGKTLQAICLLLDRAALGAQLVVAPTSVLLNWEAELARFAPGLTVHRYQGKDRAERLHHLGPSDVLVTSWTMLQNHLPLRERPFATCVLDEAQNVKNAGTQRAHAAREVSAALKLGLTGTPLENHLGELWSLLRVVAPGALGSWQRFKDELAAPIEKGGDPGVQQRLNDRVRPFVLRRTKDEVGAGLPPRRDRVVLVEGTADETRLLERIRRVAKEEVDAAQGWDKRVRVLQGLSRCRLAASHPRLVEQEQPVLSSKVRRLLELLEEDEGRRVLVFSSFVRTLRMVERCLADRQIPVSFLSGELSERQRRAEVEAFQRGDRRVFLLSLKAGGVGLNLTAADHVVLLDPWWNPAVEDQAADRAHRVGQTREVNVIRLVMKGSIEQRVLDLHDDKRRLFEAALTGTATASRLSLADLEALLAP